MKALWASYSSFVLFSICQIGIPFYYGAVASGRPNASDGLLIEAIKKAIAILQTL
jgi:hypothetical protein